MCAIICLQEIERRARALWQENAMLVQVSRFHLDVCSSLESMGYDYIMEYLDEQDLFSVRG